MFIDAAETVSIRPFQNFVFVSCSDQSTAGRGQTHVLPGGHIALEEVCTPSDPPLLVISRDLSDRLFVMYKIYLKVLRLIELV